MRCPVCQEILHDSPVALTIHRKIRKGKCGTAWVPKRAEAPMTEAERYDIDRATKAEERRMKGQPDSALQRWVRK